MRFYTTPYAAEDLEAVRRALGYGRINLDGGSYGTRLALVYLRRHAEQVRSVVLRGISPPDFCNPLPFSQAGQAALYVAETTTGRFGVYTMGPRGDGAPGLVIRRHDQSLFRQPTLP